MTRYNPLSTYRLQFSKDFTFADAMQIIPYLNKLGIKTIYASPIFQAVSGSTHGYDITNPLKINTEIGTDKEFRALINKIHEMGMGWIQDIVPNHMAFSTENPWIEDILEKGNESAYFRFFDIIPENRKELDSGEKLMLPFFAKTLDKLISENELSVHYTEKGFKIRYFEQEYPVSKNAYEYLLIPSKEFEVPIEIDNFLTGVNDTGNWDENKRRFLLQITTKPEVLNYITNCLSVFNSNPERMSQLIDKFFYRPVFWKETEKRINYRRFFTVNNMICLNIQDEKIFNTYHELIKKWSDEKLIDGIRVDHIDGIYNPTEYLERLRELCGSKMYILVEKILGKDEKLQDGWPVEGTTGYDFLSIVNNLLTNTDTGLVFQKYYNEWIEKTEEFRDVFLEKKRFLLYNRFGGELNNLTRECLTIPSISKQGMSKHDLRNGLAEFLVFCPIYKIYHAPSVFTKSDRQQISAIFEAALSENIGHKHALEALRETFLTVKADRKANSDIDIFFRHCMQFTGPIMAKGVEDTAFYSFNTFIGHNEVGDSPEYFGIQIKAFHQLMIERQKKYPLTMNSTSTHDTKRGEDARARLNVLTDIPEKWKIATKMWRKLNRKYKFFEGTKEIPTPNDEYFIYQVLCAHFPMDGKIDNLFLSRLQDYLLKALREAKVNTSWSNPDENYETKTFTFTLNIISEESDFYENFLAFLQEIIPHGIVNSMTQTILKNTCPGIPDTYQGCEGWNLSFVDPDNRRQVDFKELSDLLNEMIGESKSDAILFANKLLTESSNGQIKHWITYQTLQQRKMHENLFLKGVYIPLKPQGKYKKNLIAFLRQYQNEYCLIILPLKTATLPLEFNWEDTYIELPENGPNEWENRLTKVKIKTTGTINITEVFNHLPFGILGGISGLSSGN